MAQNKIWGIDLFAGAGGMSIGAIAAGIEVKVAVEIDRFAAYTYKANHKSITVLNDDIRRVKVENFIENDKKAIKVLFGGPPCQGFSTSNQKTRNRENEINWLFKEYLKVAKEQQPEWVIVENVKGIIETENGFFFDRINRELKKLGYKTESAILNAVDYGVPQIRKRVFIVGSKSHIDFKFPAPKKYNPVTVEEAISDLPILSNGANLEQEAYVKEPQSRYQELRRANSKYAYNNLVTKNAAFVIDRYKHIPEGGNWENIPSDLMNNYKDYTRCHTGIYHRLRNDKPSVVIGNYRKNMLIHPREDRGLSVREAARIQSFPDDFKFYGTVGFQQQQVGNAVPPLLSEAIFNEIVKMS